MSWFSKLHKNKKEETQELKFGKAEDFKVDVPKEEDKRTPQQHFNDWYNSLSAADKKKVDRKMLKNYLRNGTPVTCMKCGKPGGTLKKVSSDKYVHVTCP